MLVDIHYITVFDDNLNKIRGLVNGHNQCNGHLAKENMCNDLHICRKVWCWYTWFSAKGHHVCDFQWGLAVLTEYQPEILFHQSIMQFADRCTYQELKKLLFGIN